MPDWENIAAEELESTEWAELEELTTRKAERRQRRRHPKMKVDGASVKLLATLIKRRAKEVD